MMEELRTRHKKEVKALDGEKRSALKKTKATAGKGKKGKQALAALEQEYATKEKEIAERHKAELEALNGAGGGADAAAADGAAPELEEAGSAPSSALVASERVEGGEADGGGGGGDDKRQKARDKARRKREKAREKERQREKEIAEELANAGPSRRDLEIAALKELYLDPLGLGIREVDADGNCLYRAVADQCGGDLSDYASVRAACADALAEHEEELAPFAEIHDHGSYVAYVDKVRNSTEWGGHLELRALVQALRRPFVVYSAESAPLRMGEEFDDGEEIRLSFHRHYYALGEHYNSVVPK